MTPRRLLQLVIAASLVLVMTAAPASSGATGGWDKSWRGTITSTFSFSGATQGTESDNSSTRRWAWDERLVRVVESEIIAGRSFDYGEYKLIQLLTNTELSVRHRINAVEEGKDWSLEPGTPWTCHNLERVQANFRLEKLKRDKVWAQIELRPDGRYRLLHWFGDGSPLRYGTYLGTADGCPDKLTWSSPAVKRKRLFDEYITARTPDAEKFRTSGEPEYAPGEDMYSLSHWRPSGIYQSQIEPDRRVDADVTHGCPWERNIRTGNGYVGLTDEMKASLERLYEALESEDACFRFSNGYRSQEEQDDLYRGWHAIADRQGPQDVRTELEVNAALAKHKPPFAQTVKGWDANGIAKGGPAKQSRHTLRQAADITVLWPDDYKKDLGKFRAVASIVDLCGPIASDPVHVELPYARGKDKEPSCHFS